MSGIALLRPLLLLTLLLLVLDGSTPLSGQAAKDKVNPKKKSDLLVPEPVEIKPGDPLSRRALVSRPANIKGALSWTVETKRHRWNAIAVALSPDGKLAATGGYDGIIRLWEVPSGKLVRVLVGHDSYIYGLAFSPDGQCLASTGSHDGTARIWNPQTGMTLRVLKKHKGYTHWVAWSPDGKTLAVAGGTSGFVTFWDPVLLKQERTVEHGNAVTSLAWSPDGNTVACGTAQGASLWKASDGKPAGEFQVEGNYVFSVAWSSDSKLLLTGSRTNAVIWNVDDKKQVQTLLGQAYAGTWSPDGNTIATCPRSGVALLWDAKTFQVRQKLAFNAHAMAWDKQSTSLLGLDGITLHLQNSSNATPEKFPVAQGGTMQWTPGRPVIAGIGEKTPNLLEALTGKPQHLLEGHTGAVVGVAWSRDGKQIASASADKTARIWDAATGTLVRTLEGHGAAVNAVAWAADGKLATASADKIVRIFAPNSDKVLQECSGHTHPVTALAWMRDGRSLISGSDDRSLILWNIETGKPLKTFAAIHDVLTVALSPDGRLVASGGSDDVVRVFSVASGKLLHSFDQLGNPKAVNALAFSPDSTLIASGRANHTMQIWSTKTEKVVHNLLVLAPVQDIDWSADGKTVITSTPDRSLRTWDATSGLLRATLVLEGKQIVMIAAEGHYRSAPDLDQELVYVVQTNKSQDTYEPKVFITKFAWRNNPAAVKP